MLSVKYGGGNFAYGHVGLLKHAFYLLKIELKTERPRNKKQMKVTAGKAWQNMTSAL